MTGIIQLDCEYTRQNLMEMQKPLHRKSARLCIIMSSVGLLLFVSGLIFMQSALLIFGSFWCIFFLWQTHHASRKIVKQALKSNQKKYGQNVKTTLKFYPSLVAAQNHQTGSERKTPYGDVNRIIRTKNLLVLILPDNVAVMGDLRNVDKATSQELWEHLLETCVDAEIETTA